MVRLRSPQVRQKGFAQIVLLLFLITAIGVGVYLAQKTQIFKPRAASGPIDRCLQGELKELTTGEACPGGANSFKYRCTDGFVSEVGKGKNDCYQSDYIKEYAANSCQSHASCPTYKSLADLRTIYSIYKPNYGTVDPLALKNGEVVIVDFWSTGGSGQGVMNIHTAIWEGATSEKDAKRDNKEGNYQGFGPEQIVNSQSVIRTATVPFYMEFYSVDRDGNKEPLKKVTVKQNPAQAVVFSFNINDSLNSQSSQVLDEFESESPQSLRQQTQNKQNFIKKSAIEVFNLFVDGQYATYSPLAPEIYEFSYLEPGEHTLYFEKPAGHTVAFVVCQQGSGQKCYKQYPVLLGQKEVAGGLYAIKFNLKEGLDYTKIGMFYYPEYSEDVTSPSITPTYPPISTPSATPMPKPTAAKVECDSSGTSLNASLYFPEEKEDIKAYAIRVDNKTDGWDGSCFSKAGDFCHDVPVSPVYSFPATSEQPYELWYHKMYKDGSLGGVAAKLTFTCQ